VLIISLVFTSLFLIFKVINWYSYNQAFSKRKWAEGDLSCGYPNRKYMLKDLVNNHQIKGLTYKQLVDSIGEPRIDSNSHEAYYNIILDYGLDIDPVYSKELIIQFDRDSIVKDFKLKEWKN
jgi:hypothetical protein